MKTERQITNTNSLAVWNGKGCFPPRGSASSLRGDRSSTDAAAEGNLNVVSCVEEEEEVEHCWRRRIVAFNLLTRSFSPASSFISILFFSSEASVFLASSTRRQEFSQNSLAFSVLVSLRSLFNTSTEPVWPYAKMVEWTPPTTSVMAFLPTVSKTSSFEPSSGITESNVHDFYLSTREI